MLVPKYGGDELRCVIRQFERNIFRFDLLAEKIRLLESVDAAALRALLAGLIADRDILRPREMRSLLRFAAEVTKARTIKIFLTQANRKIKCPRKKNYTSMYIHFRQPAFGIKRRFAAHAGGGDGLFVGWIGDVTGGEDAFHAGQGAEWVLQGDEALGIQF